MSLWLILLVLGLIKVPIAALMLWIPLRSDDAMNARDDAARAESDDEDGPGGLRVSGPTEPHPRLPRPSPRRRGPHGAPVAPRRSRRVGASQSCGDRPGTRVSSGQGQRLRLR